MSATMKRMPRFSANVGFLWVDRPLPDRFAAAAAAGFSAVECHFPYDHSTGELRDALQEAAVSLVSLNTGLGAHGRDDFGVAARPGREPEARALIDQAIEYAVALECPNVNVLPGATGRAEGCEPVLRANLAYACERAAASGITVLIEPLSPASLPGAHCSLVDEALETLAAIGATNLKVLFDCFHVEMMSGGVTALLTEAFAHIGHIQIASVPDRSEPDHGTVDHVELLAMIDALGYTGWIGAEYHPRGRVEDGLSWFDRYRP